MPHVFQTVNLKATLAKIQSKRPDLPSPAKLTEKTIKELVASAGLPPVYHSMWRYRFIDCTGRKRTGRGANTEAKTLTKATARQAHENDMRDGLAKIPKPGDKPVVWEDAMKPYLAWGEARGGKRKGFGWSAQHLKCREDHLAWWKTALNATYVGDVEMPKVEGALDELAKTVGAKTVQTYCESVKNFTRWCKRRNKIGEDPLADLQTGGRVEPKDPFRVLSIEEVHRLLDAAPHERNLLYRVALLSGLRANELRQLTVASLDPFGPSLKLPAAVVKNRKRTRQFIAKDLADELLRNAQGKSPEDRLVKVPCKKTRWLNFERDRENAEIPKTLPGETDRASFHSLRKCYIQWVDESGADLKTIMECARHGSAQMSMETYAQRNTGRLKDAAESVAKVLQTVPSGPMADQRQATTDEPITQTPDSTGDCKNVPTGFESWWACHPAAERKTASSFEKSANTRANQQSESGLNEPESALPETNHGQTADKREARNPYHALFWAWEGRWFLAVFSG